MNTVFCNRELSVIFVAINDILYDLNQTLLFGVPQWRDIRKKYNIQSNIRTLLGRDYEVEKSMRFLKKVGVFDEI